MHALLIPARLTTRPPFRVVSNSSYRGYTACIGIARRHANESPKAIGSARNRDRWLVRRYQTTLLSSSARQCKSIGGSPLTLNLQRSSLESWSTATIRLARLLQRFQTVTLRLQVGCFVRWRPRLKGTHVLGQPFALMEYHARYPTPFATHQRRYSLLSLIDT